MKIRITSGHCLGGGVDVREGEVIDVEEKVALRKIRQGYAVAYVEPPAPASSPSSADNTAAHPDGEQSRASGKRRNG